jgi:hypothetical protein
MFHKPQSGDISVEKRFKMSKAPDQIYGRLNRLTTGAEKEELQKTRSNGKR